MAKANRRPASLSVCKSHQRALTVFQLSSSSFESRQHICAYFVDLFCWKKFMGGGVCVWKQTERGVKVAAISFSSERNKRTACGRSEWRRPTSSPGRASSSETPPTLAFHRCRTQRCSEPSDRPTHRSLQFSYLIHGCFIIVIILTVIVTPSSSLGGM